MKCKDILKNHRNIILFFSLLALIYVIIFLFLRQTNIYNIENSHNDRFFSADDVYYVANFYSINIDTSPRVIKHPLFIVFASLFTKTERLLFGELSIAAHYKLIVIFQIMISLLSVWYLFLILDRQYKLNQRASFLICGIYALAFSTLFYTFIAESYIFSSLILLMTYYYAHQKNVSVTIILGALAAGITITNAALWAIIVFFADGNFKKRIFTLISGGVLFCLLVAILPIRNGFFSYILPGSLSSASNYSDSFDIITCTVYVLFAFFGSTVFYLDTISCSPFGDFAGDALSFIPSASLPITAMITLWIFLLIFAIITCRKDKSLYPPLAVIGINLILHGLIQYGLKEAFLYSLHHFSAQILIIALLSKPDSNLSKIQKKLLFSFECIFLLCSVSFNIPGYIEIIKFIMK